MRAPDFHHEALLYGGPDGFVQGALNFLAPALAAGCPAVVLTDPAKIDLLRSALGPDAAGVRYEDVTEVGRNPAWLLPLWSDVMDEHAGREVWGIGEPVWPGRTPAELVECRHHELLLNVAFAQRAGFRLLCPYDVAALPPEVIEAACASHPLVSRGDGESPSPTYTDVGDGSSLLGEALPPPPPAAVRIELDADDLAAVRRHVEGIAGAVGLGGAAAKDLALAVDEVATNSLRHAEGVDRLSAWLDGGALVCEVRDAGWLTDPLVGRRCPEPTQVGGRGLWIANCLCDLVQVRSSPGGTVVRLHKRPGD
ncbi:MAG TPA: sensor histidine kinase [Acidimicrobiales bacterium]